MGVVGRISMCLTSICCFKNRIWSRWLFRIRTAGRCSCWGLPTGRRWSWRWKPKQPGFGAAAGESCGIRGRLAGIFCMCRGFSPTATPIRCYIYVCRRARSATQEQGVAFLTKLSYNENAQEGYAMDSTLEALYQVVLDRKAHPQEGSYTCYLFDKGLDKILKKVGEECAETIIAAKNDVSADTVGEVSDLIYHLLVMLAEKDIPLDGVLAELDRRAQKIGNLKQMKQVDKESWPWKNAI